jgi:hypothetical protein
VPLIYKGHRETPDDHSTIHFLPRSANTSNQPSNEPGPPPLDEEGEDPEASSPPESPPQQ